jgi:sec-independent protein translocase protein TatC
MATYADENPDDKKMPLIDHLIELRQRLLYSLLAFAAAFGVAFYFHRDIFNILARPLLATSRNEQVRTMIFTAPLEAFVTYVQVGFFAGCFLSFPIIANQLWLFVAPGLYKHEKGAFLPFLIATPFMFVLGAAVLYFFILPWGLQFLASFGELLVAPGENDVPIQFMPKMNEYLSFVMHMILAFGISFELPVLLLILVRVGVVSTEGLAKKRRYAIVGILAFAAIVTPPDILSQVGLAVPMYMLYEGSIWVGKLIERNRAKREEESSAELDAMINKKPTPSPAEAAVAAATAAPTPAPALALAPPPPNRIDETDFSVR